MNVLEAAYEGMRQAVNNLNKKGAGMKIREWLSFVSKADMPETGIFMASITDDVLDQDAWPLWIIHMTDGVIRYITKITPGVYGIPDMVDWTKDQLVEWIQEDNTGSHPCVENVLMLLGPEPKFVDVPYWFCVNITNEIQRKIALDMLSCYKVKVEVYGDGDEAQYLTISAGDRAEDIHLAEMCFSGNGWWQAKVCPICMDKGETICGHMYFTHYHEPAF